MSSGEGVCFLGSLEWVSVRWWRNLGFEELELYFYPVCTYPLSWGWDYVSFFYTGVMLDGFDPVFLFSTNSGVDHRRSLGARIPPAKETNQKVTVNHRTFDPLMQKIAGYMQFSTSPQKTKNKKQPVSYKLSHHHIRFPAKFVCSPINYHLALSYFFFFLFIHASKLEKKRKKESYAPTHTFTKKKGRKKKIQVD